MLEKHRLTYLDALGIENYMPRYQLTNALPSQLLSDDALREPAAFSTADIHSVELDSGRVIADKNVLGECEKNTPDAILPTPSVAVEVMDVLGIAPNVSSDVSGNSADVASHSSPVDVVEGIDKKAAVSEALVNTASTAEKTDIRFSLNIWRIQNELLVIDSREPAAALPTEKLLQNILRSIGYPLAQLPPSDLLRWPLFTTKKFANKKLTQTSANQSINQSINQSSEEDEARAMVQAYLSAQCSRAPIKILLLLGKNSANFALTPSGDTDVFYDQHKGTAVDTPLWESKVLVVPSLVEMLHDPMQKQITWQALQTLFVE
jgi:hypothetical protein